MLDQPQQRRRSGGSNLQRATSSRPALRTIHWIIINTLLTGLLILLAPGPLITLAVGGSAIGLAAITGANVARIRMAALSSPTLLDVVAAWFPGFVALALAIVGLALVLQSAGSELLRLGGIALFLIQVLFIAALGATAGPAEQPARRVPAGRSA